MHDKVTFIGRRSLHNYGVYLLAGAYAFEKGRLLNVCDIDKQNKIRGIVRVRKSCHGLVIFCPPNSQDLASWLLIFLQLCDLQINHLVIFLEDKQRIREDLISRLFSCRISVIYDNDTVRNTQGAILTENGEGHFNRRQSGYGDEKLSVRERSVLKGYLLGLKAHEIAKTLGLSPKTIYNYYHNCMEKMGVRNIRKLSRLYNL